MTTKRVFIGFDDYLAREGVNLHRLCFLLVRDPAEAEEITFQTLLRLATRKESDAGDERLQIFTDAIRLSRDWYGRKLRKAPTEDKLCTSSFYSMNAELLSLMRRSFAARLAAGLAAAGFTDAEIRQLGGVRARKALLSIPPEELAAARSAVPAEDRVLLLSDRVYDRFAERSVSVENAIHEARIRFDRIVPFLALIVLAFFFFCIWFAGRQGMR